MEPTLAIRVTCAVLILVPAMAGFVLQIVVTIAFLIGWKTMKNNSFYIIMVQIISCNICALFLDLYIAFPLTLTGTQYMGDSILLYRGPLFLEGVAFHGLLLLSFLLTLNRAAAFFFPEMNDDVFSPKGTTILSTGVWMYISIIVILDYAFGCEKQFLKDEFYFRYHCECTLSLRLCFANFIVYQSYVIPPTMILLYVLVYVRIRLSYHATTRGSNTQVEVRFLWQTIPLGILLSIQMISFTMLPKLPVSGYGRFFVTTATNLVTIFNNMTPPTILLVYNRDIRKYARQAFSNCFHSSAGNSTRKGYCRVLKIYK
ncbi:hypothetical protein Y032_0177g577 [Ancylostoma ceylanicum]|nr:hypothetical protein Y032_0177g577 [Ancylostoma ceylanicum]